jgi:hypothetical protein
MKKYFSAIIVFDVLLPLLIIGIPGCLLLFAFSNFQSFADSKIATFTETRDRARQSAILEAELKPVQAKVPLLKTLLSNNDVEAKLGRAIQTALERLSSDEIDQTLHEFQYGQSSIGDNLGEGRRLSLKFSSHWEPLNSAALQWESAFPNLVLESISIRRAPGTQTSAPYLESSLSYFVITEN